MLTLENLQKTEQNGETSLKQFFTGTKIGILG